MLYAKFYDREPHLLANAPLSVCQLLHDESVGRNMTISQYNVAQIYGLQGRKCPIQEVSALHCVSSRRITMLANFLREKYA